MNIILPPNNNLLLVSNSKIIASMAEVNLKLPSIIFDSAHDKVPFKSDLEHFLGKFHPALVEMADWKNHFPVTNTPSRTRRINLTTLEGTTVTFKGAGGLFPVTERGVPKKDFFRCLPPSTDQPRYSTDRFVRLNTSLNIEQIDMSHPDYERALTWKGAKNEFNHQNNLAKLSLAMPAIFAAPYIREDQSPYLNNSQEQLGYVIEVWSQGWNNLGENQLLSKVALNQPSKIFSNILTTLNAVNELTSIVRMRALLENGLTGHIPHLGNFLVNINNIHKANYEPHEKVVISDTDEVSETHLDSSPAEKFAFLTSEISHHLFRSVFEILRPLTSKEFFMFLNHENTKKIFEAILHGYFKNHSTPEEISDSSGRLSKKLLRKISDIGADLLKLTSYLNIPGIVGEAEVNRVKDFGEFYLKLLPFYTSCLSEVFLLIRSSKSLRQMNFYPNLTTDLNELKQRWANQISNIE